MEMLKALLIISQVWCLLIKTVAMVSTPSPVVLHECDCGPYKKVVETNKGSPSFVELYRCAGGPSDVHGNKVCSMTNSTWVHYHAAALSSVATVFKIENHTACEIKCGITHKQACNGEGVWNEDRCVCDCNGEKTWSVHDKKCVSADTGGTTREDDAKVVDVRFVVLIAFLELFVVSGACWFLFKHFYVGQRACFRSGGSSDYESRPLEETDGMQRKVDT